MPIYEYRCDECDSVFEVIQKFSDEPLKTCEKCGATNLKKLVSSSAFHLKGSGWYATDYGGTTGGTASETKPVNESKKEAKAASNDSE